MCTENIPIIDTNVLCCKVLLNGQVHLISTQIFSFITNEDFRIFFIMKGSNTVKPHKLGPLGGNAKEITLTYQEFRVKWLINYIEKYSKVSEI